MIVNNIIIVLQFFILSSYSFFIDWGMRKSWSCKDHVFCDLRLSSASKWLWLLISWQPHTEPSNTRLWQMKILKIFILFYQFLMTKVSSNFFGQLTRNSLLFYQFSLMNKKCFQSEESDTFKNYFENVFHSLIYLSGLSWWLELRMKKPE